MKRQRLLLWISLAIVFARPAAADTYLFGNTEGYVASLVTNVGTFTTAQSQFDPGVTNSGWWSGTLMNDDENDNYGATGPFAGIFVNDFFTFFLPSELGPITSASLSAPRGLGLGTTAGIPLIFSLFDVTTDAATLNNNA